MWLDDFRTSQKTLIEWQPGNVLMKDTQGVVSSEEICYSCHDGYVSDSRSTVWKHNNHKTFVKPSNRVTVPSKLPLSNKGEVYCGTCHSPHGAGAAPDADPAGVTSFFREKNIDSSLCVMCHSKEADFTRSNSHPLRPASFKLPDTLFESGSKPASVENKVICQTCHKAHGASGNHITVVDNKDSKLCLTCHDAQKSLLATQHDLRSSFPDEKNIKAERPVESGPCGVCHMPHNSANKLLWAKTLPEGKESKARFCLSCHSKGNVAEKVIITGTSHPLNVKPFEKIRALAGSEKPFTLPLFNMRGGLDKKGVMTCATCHDPHGAKAGPAASFLRDQQQVLCEACHHDKVLIIGTKHDLNRMAPDSKNIANKTPSEAGVCGSCHLVHNGQGAFLWSRDINTKKGSVVENLCITCHREQGMAGKKVINDYSHPVNVSPSKKGLTTTLPLFDKNGKQSKKGDMTCLTCHEPHRWDPVKTAPPVGTDLEGNAQNSFLRLQNAPSPQLCSDCHKAEMALEKTDHDLRVTAPLSKNILNQTPAESGTCGVCHQVHNSRNWIRLWAQGFARGNSLMEMMCNSCHSGDGPAKTKIPEISTHPAPKPLTNLGRDHKGDVGYFPLFQKSYGEPVKSAHISCPSCHNVHQWKPGSRTQGKGVNVEGDATNSFLRERSSIVPCKDCHGGEAIFKYKYFHKADARTNTSSRRANPRKSF
jgi:predicted CXXCH cytochrome family protein